MSKRYKELLCVGNVKGKPLGKFGSVYHSKGICPTIRSRDYKDPILVLVRYEIERKNHSTYAR